MVKQIFKLVAYILLLILLSNVGFYLFNFVNPWIGIIFGLSTVLFYLYKMAVFLETKVFKSHE